MANGITSRHHHHTSCRQKWRRQHRCDRRTAALGVYQGDCVDDLGVWVGAVCLGRGCQFPCNHHSGAVAESLPVDSIRGNVPCFINCMQQLAHFVRMQARSGIWVPGLAALLCVVCMTCIPHWKSPLAAVSTPKPYIHHLSAANPQPQGRRTDR